MNAQLDELHTSERLAAEILSKKHEMLELDERRKKNREALK